MMSVKFFVNDQSLGCQDDHIVLGDPYKTQDDPAVYACDVTMGPGPSRAIFGSTPLGAIANAVTVANALVESRGHVSWS